MTQQRQTATFLKQRLHEAGIRPYTKHGQNFLVDLNLVDFLVKVADVQPDDIVLEVGTGTGSLTARLAARAAAVVSVEIDAQLAQLASEQLSGVGNVTLLQQDVLRNKNQIESRVVNAVRQAARHQDGRFKLVANLPFNVATPVISNLLSEDPVPVSMTVTIQKEMAERIVASPSTKDYGSLSVWVQSQCYASIARVLPPSVFWPRPKVESAIIHIVTDPIKRVQLGDIRFFHRFVRSLFLHRRKFLRGVLVAVFKDRVAKDQIDRIMGEHGFGADCRAEQLSIGQIVALSETFRVALSGDL